MFSTNALPLNFFQLIVCCYSYGIHGFERVNCKHQGENDKPVKGKYQARHDVLLPLSLSISYSRYIIDLLSTITLVYAGPQFVINLSQKETKDCF